MKRLLTVLLCAINILFLCQLPTQAAEDIDSLLPAFPKIESRYVVLMDADSGEVLYSQNATQKCYPASTTKLLTALLTIENSSLSEDVTFSKAAVKSVKAGDANASISEGETMTVEQALYCLMLRSANDVAYGLGEYIGGTISNFSSMMNDRIAALGATGTHFTNASGLTDEFHYTTPYDMALIGRACFNNKTLMNIMGHKGVYTIGPTNKSKFTRYYSHRFQMLEGGDYEYPYALGGKTGYTDAAGNCLVTFAEKDGLRLVCSILNSSDKGRYTDTIALFDYYFNNYKKVPLDQFDSGLSSQNIDVLKITNAFTNDINLQLGFEDNSYLLVPNKVVPSELSGIVTYADNPAYSGKEGGFACISFYYNNTGVGNATIFAKSTDYSIVPGSNGVPANSTNYINNDKVIFINIFYIIGGFILVTGLITFVIIFTKSHKRKYSFGTTKKLHF